MQNAPTTIEINGFAVREIRKRSGIDTSPFATEVGIDQSYLSRLETGARVRVSPSVLASLVSALQLADQRSILANPHHALPVDAVATSGTKEVTVS